MYIDTGLRDPRGATTRTPSGTALAEPFLTQMTSTIGGRRVGSSEPAGSPQRGHHQKQSPRGHGGEEGSARQSGGSQESGQGAANKHPSKRGTAHGKEGGKSDH